MHLPTIKQLQYLVALHEHGHFGRAAEHSYVTQSTLSAGIRELENLLGVTLVERTRRVVRFTPLGEKIASQARDVLRESQTLASLAASEGRPLAGDLRLGVIATIAPFLLPRVLPRLRADYPDLKLFLREETSHAACEALHAGRLDCVLLAMPFACGEVESMTVARDRLFIAYPKGEAPDLQSIPPRLIEEGRLLMLEDGHCLKDHALAACNRPEIRASASMMATSLHTLVQMVDNGLGLTFVPEMALAGGIIDHTDIEARPLESEHGERVIALAWRKASPRADEFRLLGETFAALASKMRVDRAT